MSSSCYIGWDKREPVHCGQLSPHLIPLEVSTKSALPWILHVHDKTLPAKLRATPRGTAAKAWLQHGKRFYVYANTHLHMPAEHYHEMATNCMLRMGDIEWHIVFEWLRDPEDTDPSTYDIAVLTVFVNGTKDVLERPMPRSFDSLMASSLTRFNDVCGASGSVTPETKLFKFEDLLRDLYEVLGDTQSIPLVEYTGSRTTGGTPPGLPAHFLLCTKAIVANERALAHKLHTLGCYETNPDAPHNAPSCELTKLPMIVQPYPFMLMTRLPPTAFSMAAIVLPARDYATPGSPLTRSGPI